eukprot:scaffold469006_cov10-Prasinocladus_malaysianus.AAC.1
MLRIMILLLQPPWCDNRYKLPWYVWASPGIRTVAGECAGDRCGNGRDDEPSGTSTSCGTNTGRGERLARSPTLHAKPYRIIWG